MIHLPVDLDPADALLVWLHAPPVGSLLPSERAAAYRRSAPTLPLRTRVLLRCRFRARHGQRAARAALN